MNRALVFSLLLSVLFVPAFSSNAVAAQPGQGEAVMHTYIVFFAFTAQGIENIKDSPNRVEAAKEIVRSMGGEMKAFYGMLGSEFDTIFILKAPDDESVSKMVLSIASSGNVRTRTHRLFSENEYARIISELP